MSSYVLSNANRFYAGLENDYGQTPAITAQNRFPAVKLTPKNQLETADRRDQLRRDNLHDKLGGAGFGSIVWRAVSGEPGRRSGDVRGRGGRGGFERHYPEL